MSKRQKYLKDKYYMKEVLPESIQSLTDSLIEDDCYIVVRKIHFDWMIDAEHNLFIERILCTEENLLRHDKQWKLNKLSDRVYESQNTVNYHLEA